MSQGNYPAGLTQGRFDCAWDDLNCEDLEGFNQWELEQMERDAAERREDAMRTDACRVYRVYAAIQWQMVRSEAERDYPNVKALADLLGRLVAVQWGQLLMEEL